jgi:hypothetical protein
MMGTILKVSRSYGLKCNDIYAKFRKDWYRNSKVNGDDTQTALQSIFFKVRKLGQK